MISNSRDFSDSSPLKELIENCTPDNFIGNQQSGLAENLYDIMNSNIRYSGSRHCHSRLQFARSSIIWAFLR